MTATSSQRTTPRILVIGGGYVGLYTALRLLRRLGDGEASVTVVDPRSYMTYQPFLPEAAAGAIEPRHVVVPLRRVLKRCHVLNLRVSKIETARRASHVLDWTRDLMIASESPLVPAARHAGGAVRQRNASPAAPIRTGTRAQRSVPYW